MATIAFLVLVAKSLSSCIILTCLDAVGIDLLADEGGHGLDVVLETGRRVVGGAGAVVRQGRRITNVGVVSTTAKRTTGSNLTRAP